MRKVGIVMGIIILVVVAAALVFAATFDVNKYRRTIQSELEKHLGRPVTLGDMYLTIFPPRFRVQDLAIADDPEFKSETPFVKAQQLDVSVKILPLLRKQVQIDSLNLERPSVDLIKNQHGVWNFASLGRAEENTQQLPQGEPASSQPTRAPNPSRPSSAEQQFSLGELTIRNGQISILDQQTSKLPSGYDHIDITLNHFAPNKPFSIEAAAHLAGTGAEQVRLEGEGGPIVQLNPASTPFHLTLHLKQVGIADLAKFLNSPAMAGSDGILTGQTKINSRSGRLSVQGEATAQNVKLHGSDLGFPVVVDYDVTDDLTLDMLTLGNLTLKLGPTPLVITGRVNQKSVPAQLDVNVRATNVSIAEVAKLAAASGVALTPGTNVSGNVNANIQAHGAANKPALTGTVTATNIQMSGKDVPQPVQIQVTNLSLTPSEIRSSPFNVISGGTTLNTQFGLRNYQSSTPTLNATVRAPNAQLPAILAMAKAYGVTALDKIRGQGMMNLDLHAVGGLRSVSSAEILKAVNGTINLNFNNVEYSGADISRELASIAGFLNAAPKAQGLTDILKLTGNILVKNGIAETNNLQAQLDIGTMGMAGNANLADQALNMRVTAVLSPQYSQKIGGNSIGGFMRTALANSEGELVIPALVTGTFSNPKFAPDFPRVAQMRLKGLVPNLNNPQSIADTLQNFLGGAKNPAQGQPPQTNQQPAQQPNPVEQILGIFGKKNQQKQQPPPKPPK